MATLKQAEFVSRIIIDARFRYKALSDIVEKYAGEGNLYFIDAQTAIKDRAEKMTNDEVQELVSTFHYEDRKVGKVNRAFNILNKYF